MVSSYIINKLSWEARIKADKLGIPMENNNPWGHNDARDAFRHAYISARLTHDYGETVASQVGNLNELHGDIKHNQSKLENRADIHNNRIGRAIGIISDNDDEMAQRVYTSALIRALGGRTGFGRSKTGQVVLPTGAMIAQALIKSRRKSLENDLIEIFTGGKTSPMEKHKGTPPLIPDGSERGVSDLMFDAIERGVGAALSRQRTRTSTGESERSREARSSWNLSRSQQAAAFTHMVNQGSRNL